MTYLWEMNTANVPDLKQGNLVVLNPEWGTHAYLQQEFGKLFPRLVDSVDGDIIRFKMGKMTVEFARQTLKKVSGPKSRKNKH